MQFAHMTSFLSAGLNPNLVLGAIMTRIGLDYNGADFRIDGVEHASEYDGMIAAATNPLDLRRMVLVIAGNSALDTVK